MASTGAGLDDSRTMHLALELARLQTTGTGHGMFESSANAFPGDGGSQALLGGHVPVGNGHHSSPISFSVGMSGSLEDLKMSRRSQNMTECVPVPSSEHVAEIVGRQG
jgi:hypothetical protein